MISLSIVMMFVLSESLPVRCSEGVSLCEHYVDEFILAIDARESVGNTGRTEDQQCFIASRLH